MVALMQLLRRVLHAETVLIAVIVKVDVCSRFQKSTHIAPFRICPTFRIYTPLQTSLSNFTIYTHWNLPAH